MAKNANGEGSISYDKRRKRWRARVSYPARDGSGAIRRHLGWFKTRDEAHAALVEALSRGGRRRLTMDADRTTLAEYFDDWLENTARVNVTDGTYRQYSSHGRDHILPAIGTEKLSDLRAIHVRLLKQELLDKGLAPKTAAYVLGTLRAPPSTRPSRTSSSRRTRGARSRSRGSAGRGCGYSARRRRPP